MGFPQVWGLEAQGSRAGCGVWGRPLLGLETRLLPEPSLDACDDGRGGEHLLSGTLSPEGSGCITRAPPSGLAEPSSPPPKARAPNAVTLGGGASVREFRGRSTVLTCLLPAAFQVLVQSHSAGRAVWPADLRTLTAPLALAFPSSLRGFICLFFVPPPCTRTKAIWLVGLTVSLPFFFNCGTQGSQNRVWQSKP